VGAVLMLKTSSFGEWDNFPKTPTDAIRDALSKPAVVANGWNGDKFGHPEQGHRQHVAAV
jgi:hypothetical protein